MAKKLERIGKAGFYGGQFRPAGSYVDPDLIEESVPEDPPAIDDDKSPKKTENGD